MISRRSNFLLLPFWVPLLAIILRIASAPTANLSYFVLAVYALSGRVQAIQALTLSWLFSMLSSGLVPDASFAAVGRYAVLSAATLTALRFGIDRVPVRVKKTLALVVVFFCFVVFHSIVFSRMTDVSILKAISWMMAMGSMILAWGGLQPQVRQYLAHQIFAVLAIVMLLSLPLLSSPIGFKLNGTGFQGILGHPQAFGVAMCLLAAWAGGSMLAQEQPGWPSVGLFALACVMIFMSEARTGALSLILGLATAALAVSALSGRTLLSLAPGLRSGRILLLLVVGVIAVGFWWSVVSEGLDDFFAKRTESQSIAEAYEASRGGLVETMLANIKQDPLIGIGFGIGSIPDEMIVIREPVFDLPVSAIVEKGVLPIAILEEIGVIGFMLALITLFSIIRNSAYGGFTPLAVCLTAFLTNFGDSTFFSASGMGLILIILVAWSATFARSPAKKLSAVKQATEGR